MPGRRASRPKRAWPVTLAGTSRRGRAVPISRNWSGAFRRTRSGTRASGGLLGQLAVAGFPPAGRVLDHAGARAAARGRHRPAIGGGGHQHRPCGRPGLAELVEGGSHAGAGRGEQRAVIVLAVGGRLQGAHLRPVGIQLLGHQHGQGGQHPLAHLGPRHPHGGHAGGVDGHEHAGGERLRSGHRPRPPAVAQLARRHPQAGATRHRARPQRRHHRPPGRLPHRHVSLQPPSPDRLAARWMAFRMRR